MRSRDRTYPRFGEGNADVEWSWEGVGDNGMCSPRKWGQLDEEVAENNS